MLNGMNKTNPKITQWLFDFYFYIITFMKSVCNHEFELQFVPLFYLLGGDPLNACFFTCPGHKIPDEEQLYFVMDAERFLEMFGWSDCLILGAISWT